MTHVINVKQIEIKDPYKNKGLFRIIYQLLIKVVNAWEKESVDYNKDGDTPVTRKGYLVISQVQNPLLDDILMKKYLAKVVDPDVHCKSYYAQGTRNKRKASRTNKRTNKHVKKSKFYFYIKIKFK